MRLRTRITAIFVLLTALLLLGVFTFIFLFSGFYTQREFQVRMEGRLFQLATELETTPGVLTTSGRVSTPGLTPNQQPALPEEAVGVYPVPSRPDMARIVTNQGLPDAFARDLLAGGTAAWEQGGRYYRGTLLDLSQGETLLLLSARDTYGLNKQRNLLNLLILAYALSLACLLLLGEYFATQALSPINRIIRKVQSIRAGNLDDRLEVGRGKDELAELAGTFNNMLDRLEIAFDQQSRFINNASHELRNPLTAILGLTEVGQARQRDAASYRELLRDIEREAQRLDHLVDGLLQLAQTGESGKGFTAVPFRMDEIAMEIKEAMTVSGPGGRIRLDLEELPEDARGITLTGSPTLFKVALGNIVENACKYSGNEPVQLRVLNDGNDILILVADKGIGIPSGELTNIFEPFYRGSNVRSSRGYGFGLPMAYRIIRLHHGDIRISSQPGKGTLVTIRVPNLQGQRGLA